MATKKNDLPAWVSLWAGMTAGAIEGPNAITTGAITYPTEYVKTQLQIQGKNQVFKGPVDCFVKTVREKGFFALYKGLSALLIGNAAKAGVRFLAFDQFKSQLQAYGINSGTSMVLAGLGAGMSEAILVVTPSETIKTKLIHDQNQPNPRFRGLAHGTRTIIREEGFRGIYRGASAVIARQGANSAVRMSTYGLIKDYVAPYYKKDSNGKPIVPWYSTFLTGLLLLISGAFAGIVTVYCTMPLDVVKTKLQSLDAKQYHSIFDCLNKVVRNEGVFALWKGATPRLGRLIFSGGIVFTIYEGCISIYDSICS